MKKSTIIAIWFAFLLLVLIFTSCKSKQNTTSTSEEKQKFVFASEIKSSQLQIKSLAINDYIKMGVPYLITGSTDKNCDSLCNAKKEEWLRSIKTEKQSGNNGYNVGYNEQTKELEFNIRIGETVSTYRDSIRDLKSQIEFYKNKTVEVPVPYVPKVYKIFAGIGATSLLIAFLLLANFIRKKTSII